MAFRWFFGRFALQIELSIHHDELPVGILVVGLIYTAAFAVELLLRIAVFGCSASFGA